MTTLDGERMSVAYLSPSWPPGISPNGIPPYIGVITEALRLRGHTTTVLTFDAASGSPSEGIYDLREYRVQRSLPGRILHGTNLRISREDAFDRATCRMIVEATRCAISQRGVQLLEMEDSFGWGFRVRRRIPIPLIIRLHGPWFLNGPAVGESGAAGLNHRVRREGLAIRHADGITAPSHDVLERTRSYYGLALEQAEVIPPPLASIPASQRWDAAGCDPHRILFIGRFDLHKGGDLIIRAFARVLERVPQARLQFVGIDRGITDQAGRKWSIGEYLQDRLSETWQRSRVEWLDRQPPAILIELRRNAAVTVVCSRYETFGLTATEAMGQGCPLIATNVGALAEIVQDGVNGLLCRPEDPEDLANKLCHLLGNVPHAARLGRRAMADCQQRYDPGLLAERSADYYRRVIAEVRSKRTHSWPGFLRKGPELT